MVLPECLKVIIEPCFTQPCAHAHLFGLWSLALRLPAQYVILSPSSSLVPQRMLLRSCLVMAEKKSSMRLHGRSRDIGIAAG